MEITMFVCLIVISAENFASYSTGLSSMMLLVWAAGARFKLTAPQQNGFKYDSSMYSLYLSIQIIITSKPRVP